MSLGANLKRERELRGISLQEISMDTKISPRLLEALEADRFDSLPGGIFRKAFLRSYAKYLGMNEEQVLHEYTLAFESSPPIADEKQQLSKFSREPDRNRAFWIAAILGLLILGLIYFFLRTPRSAQSPQPSKSEKDSTRHSLESQSMTPSPLRTPESVTIQPGIPANGLASTSQNPVEPAAVAVNPQLKVLGELAKKPEPPPLPPGNPSEPVSNNQTELTLEATEQTWISVTSGDHRIFAGMLNPKESKKFSLQVPLNLVLGNAGGVSAIVNGQPLVPMGKTGEKKLITISAQNYKQFLPSSH